MSNRDVLLRAASLIEKKGLARKKAFDIETGAFCFGAALVEAATYGNPLVFHDKDYVAARNMVCGHLGITSSYDGMVDWNDDSYVTKNGQVIYKHKPEEAVHSLRVAAELVENPNFKEKK